MEGIINNFLTWDYLLTFTGCVAGTAIITEFIKRLFEKLSSRVYQLISYFVALIIMVGGQAATRQAVSWDVVMLDMINAAVVSLTSNGGYDAVKAIVKSVKPKTDVETEEVDEGDDE